MQPYSNHGGVTWEDPLNLFSIEGDVFEQPSLPTIIRPPTPDPKHDAVLVFQGNPYGILGISMEFNLQNVEPIRWKYGYIRVLEVRNLSPTEHPFHLHGWFLRCYPLMGFLRTTTKLKIPLMLESIKRCALVNHRR